MKHFDTNYIMNEYYSDINLDQNNIILEEWDWENFKRKVKNFWNWFINNKDNKNDPDYDETFDYTTKKYDKKAHKKYIEDLPKDNAKITFKPLLDVSEFNKVILPLTTQKTENDNDKKTKYIFNTAVKFVKGQKDIDTYKIVAILLNNTTVCGVYIYKVIDSLLFVGVLDIYDVYYDIIPYNELIELLKKVAKNDKCNIIYFNKLSDTIVKKLNGISVQLTEQKDKTNKKVIGHTCSVNKHITKSLSKVNHPLNEELDTDNLLWKVEMWFRNKPTEYKEFINVVKECIKNKTVTKELLEDFINNKKFKLKQFIDFLDDDIHNTSDTKDYFYLLKKVIECLMNDKQFEI